MPSAAGDIEKATLVQCRRSARSGSKHTPPKKMVGMMPGTAGESSYKLQRLTATGRYWVRIAIALCCIILLYVLGHAIAGIFVHRIDVMADDASVATIIAAATAVYFILLAIPFMPAAELGIALVFGAKASPPIYVTTVGALTLTYVIGRLLPVERVAAVLGHLGLSAARNLLLQLEPLSSEERQRLLSAPLPPRMANSLVRFRYPFLAVLFNLPGNVVIGGGGGIALLAGVSQVFSFPTYLLTVVIAVAPVPLLVYLFG